jgi:hypothetical protein
MYAKYFILVDSFCYAIGNGRKAWERYMKCLADVFQLKFREGKTKRKKPPHF